MADERIQYPGWEIVRELGAGSYGKVFEVKKEDSFGETENSALKHIRIPPESVSLQSYSDELGLDDKSLSEMFRKQMENIANEFSLMSKLKGNSYIVSYEDHTVIPHENEMGYDIYIRMELLKPLTALLREKYGSSEIDEAFVVKLGQDMCHALELCERNSIIHRDIKPQNIFMSRQGNFKLGDFGIAKSADHSTIGTRTGTFNYMAPEVYASKPYDQTVDLYSLGMVLYWMLNERRGPFLPLPPAVPTAEASSEAVGRRMTGEPIPAPKNGSEGLKRIVLKAISFDPKNRYQNANEMLRDLMSYGKTQAGGAAEIYNDIPSVETSVVPPVNPAPKKEPQSPKAAKIPEGTKKAEKIPDGKKKAEGKKKKKLWLIPVIIGGAILVMIAASVIVALIVNTKTEREERQREASEAAAEAERLKHIPVEILNGVWEIKYLNYKASNEYMKQSFFGVECELHSYPDGFSVLQSSLPENMGPYIVVKYSDRYGESYGVYSEFSFSNGLLQLTPPKTALPTEDFYPLSDPVTYYMSSMKQSGGIPRISTVEGINTDSYAEYRNAYEDSTDMRYIQGSANDPAHCYKELLSLNLEFLYDEKESAAKKTYSCDVIFTDGGYAINPEISSYYDGVHSLYLKWDSRMISYNGRMQDDGKAGRLSSIKIINCYPNGFIIYDENKDEYYIYQNAPMEIKD